MEKEDIIAIVFALVSSVFALALLLLFIGGLVAIPTYAIIQIIETFKN